MSDELKPVRCGCGGKVAVLVGEDEFHRWKLWYRVKCWECGIQTQQKRTKAEAITAWNTAMGAKDINVPAKSVENIYSVGDHDKIYVYGFCPECGSAVIKPDKYCSECGCRLEWSHE